MQGHILFKDETTTYYDVDNEIVVVQKIECPHCHGAADLVRECGVMLGSCYCPRCDEE